LWKKFKKMIKKQKKIKKSGNKKDHNAILKFINKFLLLIIIFSGISFVVSINDLSIKGFMLEKLKKESYNLSVENENIELLVMELESYDNIIKKAEELKMVKVDSIEYIEVNDEAVAKK